MLIAITGHTSGIGKAIYNYFSKDNLIIGFSRTNGYDISIEDDRKKIIDESYNSNIFINNAYNNYDNSQTLLLKEIFNKWKNEQSKLIINISSRWTTGNNKYCAAKKEQDNFWEQNIFLYPKIINIKPGLIDTPRVINESGVKQSTNDLIDILDFIIKTQNKYKISSITFGN